MCQQTCLVLLETPCQIPASKQTGGEKYLRRPRVNNPVLNILLQIPKRPGFILVCSCGDHSLPRVNHNFGAGTVDGE